MTALQTWLQNHNRKLSQDAIDEALMECIAHIEKQRDELLAALERIECEPINAEFMAREAIASVKGGAA